MASLRESSDMLRKIKSAALEKVTPECIVGRLKQRFLCKQSSVTSHEQERVVFPKSLSMRQEDKPGIYADVIAMTC